MNLYLAPPCRPSTLDSFGNRRLVLSALHEALPSFSGAVLDVGCGHKPYRETLLAAPSHAQHYIGLDLPGNPYSQPDVEWDGVTIPLPDKSVDSCLFTEVLEHCPDGQAVLNEIARVLKPGGFLFLTVPFIWPIHTVPHDEYRYTPFALRRVLDRAGFKGIDLQATGGRDAVLGIMLGLWVRRRPIDTRAQRAVRYLLSGLLWPVIGWLMKIDKPPSEFEESTLIVGLKASARRA